MKINALPALLTVTILTACSPGPDHASTDGTWAGTITTEGNVTKVVNESGSVWGGTATLVEEASIGVESGPEEYMFGRVRSIAASSDHIYVADNQVPALRAYDWSGRHVRDFGRRGQGPGEFETSPYVGVDGDGRVWLQDTGGARILVFSSAGEPIATLPQRPPLVSGFTPMVVTPDGRGFILDLIRETTSASRRRGMTPYKLDGSVGKMVDFPEFESPPAFEAEGNGEIRFFTVPFHPRGVSVFGPAAAMLSGYSDTYKFQVAYLDDRTKVIERRGVVVPVGPEEVAALKTAAVGFMRGVDRGWAWPGAAIPDTKPAYSDLVATVSGEVWVVRQGPSTPIPDCDEAAFEPDGKAHCWRKKRLVDAFDAEGRYLGEVDVPEDIMFSPRPFIRGEDVIAVIEDDAGTIMVKRYRLLLPGEDVQ